MRSLAAFGFFLLPILTAHANTSTDQLHYNLINLQADASRQVVNDEMHSVLYIEKSYRQPAELAAAINQQMNNALALAKRYPQVKVHTGSQTTYPVYDDKNKLKEWRSRAQLELTSTDFKAASQLISELQQNFQTESLDFTVSNAQRVKVENELMLEASKNFQQRAQLLTQAWNKSQYTLVNFNINSNRYAPQPYARMNLSKALSSEAIAPQNVNAGESNISVNVSGSIQLK